MPIHLLQNCPTNRILRSLVLSSSHANPSSTTKLTAPGGRTTGKDRGCEPVRSVGKYIAARMLQLYRLVLLLPA